MAGAGKGEFGFRMVADPSPRAIGKILGQLGDDLRDWSPVWRRIAPMIADSIAQNLSSKGSSLGEPWPAESAAYVQRKLRDSRGRGRTDMVFSGKLVASLIGAGRGVISMTPRRLVYGTRVPYARAQHFGFTGKKHSIPARRFVAWTDAMKGRALEEMNAHAKAMLAAAAQRVAQAGGA